MTHRPLRGAQPYTHRRCTITKTTIIEWAIWTEAEGLIDSSGNASLEQMTKLIERTSNQGRRELLAEVHQVIDECTECSGMEHVAWITD